MDGIILSILFLIDNLSLEEANQKEKYFIKIYESTNRNKGYNLKTGGNNGYQLSKETKQKIRLSNQLYAKNNLDKLLIRLEKMHEKARKKVICLNNNKIFNSQLEAANYAGLKNSTPISRCCRGERKTAGKHPISGERLTWKFYKAKEENK